jgi:membrane protease YdiL (CAAX protease family)
MYILRRFRMSINSGAILNCEIALELEGGGKNMNQASYVIPKVKIEKHKLIKLFYGGIAVGILFTVQVLAGKSGWAVADLFSYERVDFYNIYARVSVHHIIQMIMALAVIAALTGLLKVDFGLKLGDTKKGMNYIKVYTAAFSIFTLISHLLMYFYNMLPVFDFPLDKTNVIGTLGFQLLLSGTSEEILYRALPITVLVHVFGKSVNIKRNITLETITASFLFSIAHIKWSLSPFTIEMNYFQFLYAFVLGTIQGKAYQETHSILYPMYMHSISNVLMVGTGYLFAVLK